MTRTERAKASARREISAGVRNLRSLSRFHIRRNHNVGNDVFRHCFDLFARLLPLSALKTIGSSHAAIFACPAALGWSPFMRLSLRWISRCTRSCGIRTILMLRSRSLEKIALILSFVCQPSPFAESLMEPSKIATLVPAGTSESRRLRRPWCVPSVRVDDLHIYALRAQQRLELRRESLAWIDSRTCASSVPRAVGLACSERDDIALSANAACEQTRSKSAARKVEVNLRISPSADNAPRKKPVATKTRCGTVCWSRQVVKLAVEAM